MRAVVGSASRARVAMLVSNAHAPDPRVAKEATSLARAGYAVTVYAFDRYHEQPEGCRDEDGVRVERIRALRPLPRNLVGAAAGLLYFRREARRRIARAAPDVVHCHDHDTCSVGVWWKRRGGAQAGVAHPRFVFDAHDLYWTWALLPAPDAPARRALAAALELSDRRFARAADLLITVTEGSGAHEGTAEIYRRWGCSALVVWNAPQAPEQVPPLPERFTVGYLGNVREPAMFARLLGAIGRMPQAHRPALRVAGMGRSEHEVRSLVERESVRLGISARVSGAFTPADLPQLMAECTVQYCVYPTRRGNVDRAMPVKLLESVAYGRRVIGNADSLMGDFIARHGWGWAVREADEAALAAVLEEAHEKHVAEGRRPASLPRPPLWSEQAERLIAAYAAL